MSAPASPGARMPIGRTHGRPKKPSGAGPPTGCKTERKSMRHTHRTWPTLQARTRDGRAKYWTISVEIAGFDGHEVYVVPSYWQGNDGAVQTAPRRVQGKNIGKANETSP